jgi:hypothetical protein
LTIFATLLPDKFKFVCSGLKQQLFLFKAFHIPNFADKVVELIKLLLSPPFQRFVLDTEMWM